MASHPEKFELSKQANTASAGRRREHPGGYLNFHTSAI
jgi:hypothetical protein